MTICNIKYFEIKISDNWDQKYSFLIYLVKLTAKFLSIIKKLIRWPMSNKCSQICVSSNRTRTGNLQIRVSQLILSRGISQLRDPRIVAVVVWKVLMMSVMLVLFSAYIAAVNSTDNQRSVVGLQSGNIIRV